MRGISATGSIKSLSYGLLPAAAGLAFCAIILWCLAGNLMFPHYGFFQYKTPWALAAAGAVLLLMTGLYFALRTVQPALLRHRLLSRLASAALWAGLFALQVRLAYAVRLPADWDARAIYTSAAGLALGTRESIDSGYFSLNPNNILLTLLLASWFSLVTSLGVTNLEMAAAFLNAVVLFAGIALTYAAARMLGGRAVAAFTLLPSTIFVLLSPWLGVFYSDTAGLLFPVLILCLLLAAQRARRLAVRIPLWVLAGTAGAAGYGIKPTVLICLLAAGITAACSPALRGRDRGAGILLLGAAVVAGSFFAGHRLITAVEQQGTAVGFDVEANPNALPPTHFLKVGAHLVPGKYGPLYGSYNEADVRSTASAGDPREKFQHGLDAYADRVAAMGPGGYVSFLNNKLLWITGDGSFFAWGEGVLDGDDYVSDNPADRSIQDVFGYGNPGFPWLFALWQGTWFIVLGLVAVPLFLRTPTLMLPEVSALRIALLGLLVFLLLSEGRARFLYLYTPYFILLASLSFFAVMDRMSGGRNAGTAGPAHSKGREVIE
ncbi:hypothetical protein [Arthrobacter sunyaminii]|uniref:Glycosyltransferase RgtA/B/C/D-like domain-containing protein n=1 Tax=Arthrobacter sunyaminii TaxID=2816859 RepID=A0A975S4F7_9MICC|nr:hypothetical protein [Arthrobacter sunyaminii]MBO0907196.1 hypothetical protein [Arthrobacter sunyaminii]QWQ34812.1 hypothetical protein KG104_09595 [Arthrobacter sunyaminii]